MPKSNDCESDFESGHDSDTDSAWSSKGPSDSHDDSSSSSSSSYNDNDNDFIWRNKALSGLVSSIRRRAVLGGTSSSTTNDKVGDGHVRDAREREHRKKGQPGIVATCCSSYHKRCPGLCSPSAATVILLLSIVIWIMARALDTSPFLEHILSENDKNDAKRIRERMGLDRHLKQDLEELKGRRSKLHAEKAHGQFTKTKREFPKACHSEPWQTMSHPNCNDIHEIDLGELLPTLFNRTINPPLGKSGREQPKYIDSGLWRDVFRMQPRLNSAGSSVNERVVLKIMKEEHDVDDRNLDRHRRDAIVMEKMTSSPNVVSLFGYCGNTVMTEHIDQDLETAIQQYSISHDNPLRRLHLALGAAKGLAALHEFSGGPIIHADIQSRQFLVDSTGQVKLNDFNRCRFRPKLNVTGEYCKIRIPTSPGINRSPEEYNDEQLDEKLDVYSLANVMYEIINRDKPWVEEGTKSAKRMIGGGQKPKMRPLKPGTSDASLAVLMERAYALNPAERISAAELVSELENLLEIEEGKG
jgi:serine/threonine protein kinase